MNNRSISHGLFLQLLNGEHRSYSEDRLTQVTAACFNHSNEFRRCLMRFLGIRNASNSSKASASTQLPVWGRGDFGRLDLGISRNGTLAAIVENKVESPLNVAQLKHYSRVPELKTAKKIILVKNYFDRSLVVDGWRLLHWRDFYLQLCRTRREKSLSETDRLVINNAIEYLEATHMHVPTEISKQALNDLAKTLRGIRYPKKISFSNVYSTTPVFETAADWISMMEAVFEQSRLTTKLEKAARKKYRFKPCVSHWYQNGTEGKNKKYPWVSIHASISFHKPRGNTAGVGFGLFVNEYARWSVDAFRWFEGNRSDEEKRLIDGRRNVLLTELSKQVLTTWGRWLR